VVKLLAGAKSSFYMVKEFDTSPLAPLLNTQDLTFEVGPQAHGTLVSEAGCGMGGFKIYRSSWMNPTKISTKFI
jgi:hypothetical protein